MEPTPTPVENPLAAAVERLVSELEREHAWLAELRSDTERVERKCGHLLNAADAALSALDPAGRRPYAVRIRRLQIDTARLGRPPKDKRMGTILAFLAERGGGRVTNAELRTHLNGLGLKGTSDYVGATLHRLTADGMVHRTGYGEYAIAPDHPRLRALRWRQRGGEVADEIRAERAEKRSGRRPDGPAADRTEIDAELATLKAMMAMRGLPEPDDAAPAHPRQTDENGLYGPEW